ncbi:recombinase RecT, partial [Escherichia coli]
IILALTITHVYAVAKLKDGGVQFEVMTRKQVEKVRDTHSKAAKNAASKGAPSIWDEHFEDMAKKTVIRKLFKYLPVSIEIQRAVSMDGKEVETINPDDISVIAGEYSVIDNPEE